MTMIRFLSGTIGGLIDLTQLWLILYFRCRFNTFKDLRSGAPQYTPKCAKCLELIEILVSTLVISDLKAQPIDQLADNNINPREPAAWLYLDIKAQLASTEKGSLIEKASSQKID
ncbi:hypothetical protein SYNPS1DRAFT_28701 [Syncephalis pseudoplumigaleata]|uniref:Uncharacterized protein n=1 Tax=Syncephalis pseudoplumigaleata TaxID=1712513 RepID=A0A4P9YZK1_9FUNG|nr:hypothetical protein SYNPS1DRAFT_28701 [Syncephalis pseudoplumigaleata]|eukprot:RKP25566.1 hypothetical protein SYNPS1DRAFT_28701 [Syncephalis pseudoplumigaleata]